MDIHTLLPPHGLFTMHAIGVFPIQAISRPPAHPPLAGEQLVHHLHGDALCLGGPQAQNDESSRADQSPEDVGAVDVEGDKHVGGDADDGELEEPVQRHVGGVADAADARRVDLGAVQVLHGAEPDGPADGVDEDRGDGGVGRRLVAAALPHRHVDGHVDVCDALQGEARQHAAPSADLVDQPPGEDHGEDELDDPVGARRDQRRVGTFDAGVFEDLWLRRKTSVVDLDRHTERERERQKEANNVKPVKANAQLANTHLRDIISDTIATGPLSNSLHDSPEEEPFPIRRIARDVLCDGPKG